MSQRRSLKSKLHRMSHSFLSTATACPLQGFWDGIVEIPVPENPAAVHGQMMHYLFAQFFTPHRSTKRYPYQEESKLIGAFGNLWWGAVKGDHGFHSRGAAPTTVAWKDSDQPGQFFGRGVNLLKLFFARAHPIRLDDKIEQRLVERRATIDWGGLTVTGIFDRIEVGTFALADGSQVWGARIVDYKPSEYALHQVLGGTQFTIYQWLYETAIRTRLRGSPPLVQMQVHNYGRDVIVDVPLRDAGAFDEVQRLMRQVANYYLAILRGASVTDVYPFFDLTDLETGTISPKLPRGQHCGYCGHVVDCQRYAQLSLAERRALLAQQIVERYGRSANLAQLELGVMIEPTVSPGTSARTYQQLRRRADVAQLSLKVE